MESLVDARAQIHPVRSLPEPVRLTPAGESRTKGAVHGLLEGDAPLPRDGLQLRSDILVQGKR